MVRIETSQCCFCDSGRGVGCKTLPALESAATQYPSLALLTNGRSESRLRRALKRLARL